MSVSFGSWKVLEAKRVVICIGLWGLEDLCLDVCSVFGGCFSEVLLRYERLPFASQLGWLGLMRHDARHRSNMVFTSIMSKALLQQRSAILVKRDPVDRQTMSY